MKITLIKDTYLYIAPSVQSDIKITHGTYEILYFLSSDFTTEFIPFLSLDYLIYFLPTQALDCDDLLFVDKQIFVYILTHCLTAHEDSYWRAICLACKEFDIIDRSEFSIFLSLVAAGSNSMHSREENIKWSSSYNNRVDLGNDLGTNYGILYRGRGLIHIKGYNEYKEFAERINLDIIKAPHLINSSAITEARAAAMCWKKHNLKELADHTWPNLKKIILRTFKSYTGLEQLLGYWVRARDKLSN